MTKEDKELLLKDLCARLPYGVMLKTDNVFPQKLEGIAFDKDTFLISVSDGAFTLDWMTCRPYLYPLSSMTEEQKKEYAHILVMSSNLDYSQLLGMTVEDWFNKNHFDYRGLIPKNLGIDATGLNIY
jgi:hypothetical protein